MKHLTNCSRSRCLFVTYFSKFQHQGSMVIFPLHRDLGWLWLYLVKEDVPRMNSLGILWQRNLLLKREYLLLAEVDEHHHRRQLWNPWYCGWSESWAPPQRRKGGGWPWGWISIYIAMNKCMKSRERNNNYEQRRDESGKVSGVVFVLVGWYHPVRTKPWRLLMTRVRCVRVYPTGTRGYVTGTGAA